MRWLFQFGLITLVFFARYKAIKQFQRAIEIQLWDHGIYRFIPLEGEKAIKLAKIGIKLSNIAAWGTVVMLIIHNIWDFIIFPYLYPGK